MNESFQGSISRFYQKYPEACAGPSGIKEIEQAEEDLKVKFSSEYKWYLEKFGGGAFEDLDISGVKEMMSMGTKVVSVVEKTKFYKESQKWPGVENWYIISDDGSGNPIGIDPEGKVWLSDHDSGFEQIKLADSFEEFLYKLLTDTLYQ
ncbi:MAG: SMI1/KNR4 family protein [Proteobacteria bacterium]|nr:SMI1/KNR4 family protein [Pseudomonadota bacterium]